MISYLIEYRDPQTGITAGYIKDIDTAGTFDVIMTCDPNSAIKFSTRNSAQSIIDDPAFRHAMSGRTFVVEEHMWMDGPSLDSGDA